MATIRSTIELVDKMSATITKIETNVNNLKNTLKSVTDDNQSNIDNFSWDKFLANAENAGEKMTAIGQKMSLAISAPLLLLGKKMYNTAAEYESAFAGVKKTVTATDEEFDTLYGDLLNIAETNPTGFVDAASIMEMAGQMGVATDELTKFTQAYIGLQESTDINGQEGAEKLAQFLNVTDKTTSNIGKLGGVIVQLGNSLPTTEAQILEMATRMGATGDLAGFSSTEIIAFSAALSSVGINAEAGGSAAGKLMKKMQLAAEVGGTAAERLSEAGYSFDGALDFSHWLDIAKKADLVDLADDLGMTTDAVKDLSKAWLAMEQFSEVMGVDSAGFLEGWKEGPAQAMLQFFQGLGGLDPKKGNSVLAQLAEMDLTEIRLSNLVAAMAGNSDLFQQALEMAYEQYGMEEDANAMAEEVAKRYETQESQNAMLGNKWENTMANFGENLVKLIQPALDTANQLLTAFNSLSEVDQTNILKGLGIIALLGPGLSISGKAIQLIASSMQLISGNGSSAANAVKGVVEASGSGAAANAATTAATAGGWLSSLLGVGGLGAIVGGFVAAANERKNNPNIRGSANAINQATQGNAELQAAFVEYVQSQQALQGLFDSNDYWNLDASGQEAMANQAADRAEAATQALQAMEGFQAVLDAYSAWRQENAMGSTDWVLPENLSEIFSAAGLEITTGLGQGITDNAAVATQAVSTLGTNTINAAEQALGVNSPSTYTIAAGLALDQGLVIGINNGSGMVVAAAVAMARRVLSAMRAAMGVHSPSTETYWQGEMLIAGYNNAISDGEKTLQRTVVGMNEGVSAAWNDSVWDMIGGFADTEAQALRDQMNNVEDGIKVSDSDIKKMRQLAEREVINQFTTAEVRVEMNNNNTISSDMDIDGIIMQLEDRVSERLEAVAEGVYV